MNDALRQEVQNSLSSSHTSGPLPAWVVDRVHEFTAQWYPLVKDTDPVLVPAPGKKVIGMGSGGKGKEEGYDLIVNRVMEMPEIVSARLQDLYLGLEQDVRIRGLSFWRVGSGEGCEENDSEQGKEESMEEGSEDEDERRVRDKIDNEARIKEVMDVVERTICSLFYDRSGFRFLLSLWLEGSLTRLDCTCNPLRMTHHTTRRCRVVWLP